MSQVAEALTVGNDVASGTVFDRGATVTDWSPKGTEPVLWLSSISDFTNPEHIRGGIPICFPWFGLGFTWDRRPRHGVARLANWHRDEVYEAPETASVQYRLSSDDVADLDDGDSWVATYFAGFGTDLELELTVTNTGDDTFVFEEALHTYIAVSDVREIQVTGLEQAPYIDKTLDFAGGIQVAPIKLGDEFDRVYTSTASVRVVDPGYQRAVVVTKTASANTVIWNPGADIAAVIPDLPDGEWMRFICVEGGNVKDHAISLDPQQSHTMGYTIRIEKL